MLSSVPSRVPGTHSINSWWSKLDLGLPHLLGPLPHHFALHGGKAASKLSKLQILELEATPPPDLFFSDSFSPPWPPCPGPPLWPIVGGGHLVPYSKPGPELFWSSAFGHLPSPGSIALFLFLTPGLGFPAGASPLFCVAQGQPYCQVVWSTLPISFLLEAVLERS